MGRHSSKVAALVLVAAACDGAPGAIDLSWRLADGRRCVDSGALQVRVLSATGVVAQVACTDGEPPARANVPTPAGGGALRVEAQSYQGAVLYAGSLEVPAGARGPVDVTLFYTGGN